jgi:hypothetical protein
MTSLLTASILAIASVAAASLGCASTSAKAISEPVRFYNAYRTGAEALPTTIEGCTSLGRVSASVPEPQGSVNIGFFDPKPLLETLDTRARHKGADTAVVLLAPDRLQQGSRTLQATIFHCGDHPVSPEAGYPL